MKKENDARIAVLDVPVAGAMAGLGRNASYEAARRGEIPTLKFGKRIVVPSAAWRKKLGLGSESE